MPVVLFSPQFCFHLKSDVLKIDIPTQGLYVLLGNIVIGTFPVLCVQEVGQLFPERQMIHWWNENQKMNSVFPISLPADPDSEIGITLSHLWDILAEEWSTGREQGEKCLSDLISDTSTLNFLLFPLPFPPVPFWPRAWDPLNTLF